MPTPGLFTQREEQLYEEIVADTDRHRAEYDRCIDLLQPYFKRSNSTVFSAEEEKAYKELEEQAFYQRRAWQQCQLRLKPYRDNKNTWDYAMREAAAKGFREKAQEIARKALRKNMPLAQIAELTDLTEAEIEALRE